MGTTTNDTLLSNSFGSGPRWTLALRGAWLAFAAIGRALAHRRDVRALALLDDAGLKDIGLVRGDVTAALARPLVRDPSLVLAVRATERRARARSDHGANHLPAAWR